MASEVIRPSAVEALTRDVFLALMWAFSYPGRRQLLPAACCGTEPALRAVAAALLDSETTHFTRDERAADLIAVTGSRRREADRADYAFFLRMTADDLTDFAALSAGDLEYPDRGATAIVFCDAAEGVQRMRVSGPGVDGRMEIDMPRLPENFWSVRERLIHYPLGVDVFVVTEDSVIGIPRTTGVAPCM